MTLGQRLLTSLLAFFFFFMYKVGLMLLTGGWGGLNETTGVLGEQAGNGTSEEKLHKKFS